ncbi:MAG TPA: PspC domain-containing protein [Candidatus Dormibacteraeota bacterium]|nr:PspC domain-containing protein [Candidatus Dormibacteraeota bacterium]
MVRSSPGEQGSRHCPPSAADGTLRAEVLALSTVSRERLLRRSRSDRVLGGVCAGLGHFFGTDPLLIRLIFVVIALAQGAGLLVYILLWILIPEEGVQNPPAGGQLVKSGLEGVRQDVQQAAEGFRAGAPHRQGAWLGGLLVLVGAYLLAVNAGLLAWWNWSVAGPLMLIGVGLILVVRRFR